MRVRVAVLSLSAMLVLAGCGARTALTPDDPGSPDGWIPADAGVDRDPGPGLRPVCGPLVDRRGSYRGTWQGIVNCLAEKHPSQGVLTLELSSASTPAVGLRVSGQFTGTFSNGRSLRSRVVGQLACDGRARVDLVDIAIGNVPVAQLDGWLREWLFAKQRSVARRISGAWRIDQWDPLCIGAGSWEVRRKPTP